LATDAKPIPGIQTDSEIRVKKAGSATDPLWYKDAVIYELHVRAFQDSNGDGIGDFAGLLSRLDYLQDLGVTCLWLLPFFPSPLRDDGYDISNYVDVNPVYGTLDDFKQFLAAAHQRNMQVMIELVINHTSDQHPWFQRARRAPTGTSERDFYVWSPSDHLYKEARIIFSDTEKSNWTWDEQAKAYYWHRFFSHQPDLNYDNPAVLEEILKAMRFWLDMGVDALRMDAIPYLVERDHTSCENLPESHAIVKKIRAAIDAEYANRFILAEANQWPADVRPYFGDGDECQMAFHFPLMPRIYMALRQEDRLPITDIMAQTPAIPDTCQWGLFLRNHDELTLEMVTNDERDYMYLAYSADPRMRINIGIRRRLAPLLDNNRGRIELLNSLLFSFPGTPILYYGDEIGMGDNIYLGDRNGVRTPMQWTGDRNAGFSRAVPARLYAPVIMDPIWGYQAVNVEAQLSDQSSLLHWTRNMIALRKLFKVFGRGTQEFLAPDNRKVLAYLRQYTRDDGSVETVLCVANLPTPSRSRPTPSSGSNCSPRPKSPRPPPSRPKRPHSTSSPAPGTTFSPHPASACCRNCFPHTSSASAGSAQNPAPSPASASSTGWNSRPSPQPSSLSKSPSHQTRRPIPTNSPWPSPPAPKPTPFAPPRQPPSSRRSPPPTARLSCTMPPPAKTSAKPSSL
jgi:maltose alpha-D-glucosyltransferase/alpha-amylase